MDHEGRESSERREKGRLIFFAFVGAPLACELFRHKTQKLPFRQKFWIVEIISVAWVVIYYLSLVFILGVTFS